MQLTGKQRKDAGKDKKRNGGEQSLTQRREKTQQQIQVQVGEFREET